MNKLVLIIWIILEALIGCRPKDKKMIPSSKNTSKQEIYIGYNGFKLIGSLTKVLRVEKEPEDKRKYFTECYDWTFDDVFLKDLLKRMKQVEPSYAHQVCEYFPCWYVGKVTNGNTEYEITIYAHSAITLENDKETFFSSWKKNQTFL